MVQQLWRMIAPWLTLPPRWRLPFFLVGGVLVGMLLALLPLSNALSYLSDRPETCMNCHVMATQYATWQHSNHRQWATCVDCHVPHDNIVHKYLFKAQDGLRHSYVFTFRLEPQVIRIKDAGRKVVQGNCERCHQSLVSEIDSRNWTPLPQHGQTHVCWSCHREVPHGTVNSLAAVPFARVPKLDRVVPPYLTRLMDKEERK